jgi:hypothetical protein
MGSVITLFLLSSSVPSFVCEALFSLFENPFRILTGLGFSVQIVLLVLNCFLLALVRFLAPLLLIARLIVQELVQISLLRRIWVDSLLFRHHLRCEGAALCLPLGFLLPHNLKFLLFPVQIALNSRLQLFDIEFILVHPFVVLLRNEHVGAVFVVILLDQLVVRFFEILFVFWVVGTRFLFFAKFVLLTAISLKLAPIRTRAQLLGVVAGRVVVGQLGNWLDLLV